MKFHAALIALASAVNAHMIMKTPIPAGQPISSPLSPDGGNFPCQTGPGKLDTSNPNVMSVGSSNTLSFTGSATHGGGSCQVSLAKGTDLSADTKWMVIHSIEGGCPAPNNGNQNLGSDPNGDGASKFQFTIPDHPDLGPGDYTLAWTWNNRIGNREFYMNCAYVQLSGATKKRYAPSKPAVSKRQQAPLPAMFVANIGNGCTTAEGIDVEYPDPGQSLEIGPGANLGKPSGNCGAVGATPANPQIDGSSSSASGSSPSSSSPSGSSPSGSSPAVSNTVSPVQSSTSAFGGQQPSSAANSGYGRPGNGQYTQTNPGVFATVTAGAGATGNPSNGQLTQTAPNVFATGAASQPALTASAAVSASLEPSSPAASAPSEPEPTATGSPSTPDSGSQTPTGGSCEEGDWDCAADGKSFRRCASSTWSAPIQMADGMSCIPGISANFAYNSSGLGANAKRDLRSHIARRRHNLHSPSFS